LEKEATLGGFGVALSGAGGKSLSDNDLDGWIEGFFCKPEISKAFSWAEVELHMFYDEM